MEAFLFAILIATLVTRKGLADIPFMVRGKTPPSHERRMAEMQARERRMERHHQLKVSKLARPRGKARSYFGALWDHAWHQAAQRRQMKWEVRDPVKAERYHAKAFAKAQGTYRGPVRRTIDRGRDLHAKALRVTRGATSDADLEPPTPGGAWDRHDGGRTGEPRWQSFTRGYESVGDWDTATAKADILSVKRTDTGEYEWHVQRGTDGETIKSGTAPTLERAKAEAERQGVELGFVRPLQPLCERQDAARESGYAADTATPSSAAAEPSPRGDAAGEAPTESTPEPARFSDGTEIMPWFCQQPGCQGRVHADGTYPRTDGMWRVDGQCDACGTRAHTIQALDQSNPIIELGRILDEPLDEEGVPDDSDDTPEHDTTTSTPKENTMTAAPSEAIGVEAFAAALEQHRQAAEGGTPAIEGLIASAQQQQVGPSVTDPLAQAQELYGQFVAKIEEAQQGLQQSVNVGESYSSNPDAGDAAFVTNGARS